MIAALPGAEDFLDPRDRTGRSRAVVRFERWRLGSQRWRLRIKPRGSARRLRSPFRPRARRRLYRRRPRPAHPERSKGRH